MAAIFGKRKIFLKNGQSILHIYPVGQKFCRNHSISHGLGDTSNLKFYHFCQKFNNSKWPPFLERGKIFENWAEYLAYISCGPKILLKSLYLARFRRYKQFTFYHFRQKFENSKWPPFLERGKIFENWAEYLAYISCGQKILPKSLYLRRFRRYKQF